MPNYGVIVGRFQVNDLHDGHMELLRQVRARHNRVIVFVGTSPGGLSRKNPLDFTTRRAMIQAKFPEFNVLLLGDRRTDEEWSRDLDAQISSVIGAGSATLYGSRDSFIPHYKGRLIPVELVLPIGTERVSGTDIREQFSDNVIESAEFRAGLIYAANQRWPETLPCVDIAIFNDDETELLLAQKEGENLWRFVGGHYERLKHSSFEAAARAETLEETGLDLITLEYVGSCPIDDWRYADSPDHGIATAFFRGRAMTKQARAQDDIKSVKWFAIERLRAYDFVPEHRVLYALLLMSKKEKHANTAAQSTATNG
jgi:bifunctional NMN adenylyltransferase/nudix hydrolase